MAGGAFKYFDVKAKATTDKKNVAPGGQPLPAGSENPKSLHRPSTVKHRTYYMCRRVSKAQRGEPCNWFYVSTGYGLQRTSKSASEQDRRKKNRTSKKLMRLKKQGKTKNKYLKINTIKTFIKILIVTDSFNTRNYF